MKTTVWKSKKKVTIFIGGDPAKGTSPEITLELDSPQIQIDSETNTIVILETK
jgi:hypothetical protein